MTDYIEQQTEQFPVRYSPDFAKGMYGKSLVVSVFDANMVVIVSPNEDGTLKITSLPMARPMGISYSRRHGLAIAIHDGIVFYQNHPHLAEATELEAMFIPYSMHVTGFVDMHDIDFAPNGDVLGAMTMFSSVGRIRRGEMESFAVDYIPRFITELDGTDRCHLNGLATWYGNLSHITALGMTNEAHAWRSEDLQNGVLLDVNTEEVVLGNLYMPHSPRWFGHELILLESATGTVVSAGNRGRHKRQDVISLPGLTRGMSVNHPVAHAAVGLSRARKTRSEADKPLQLPVTQGPVISGVALVDLWASELCGTIEFPEFMGEVFSVCWLPFESMGIAQWGSKASRFSYRVKFVEDSYDDNSGPDAASFTAPEPQHSYLLPRY